MVTGLIRKQAELPATITGLHSFILIGKELLRAHRAKIRAIDKIDDAHAAKSAALSDGQDVAEVLLDAEAKLGELLAAIQPEFVTSTDGRQEVGYKKPPKQTRSLPEGITHKESHQAQIIARHPDVIEQVKQKAREEDRLPTAQEVCRAIKTTCSLWTGDQESYTPAQYIEATREVMGGIDLDPASCEAAQEVIMAETYFTKEDNGLDKPWNGNVFLNPPYSHPAVKHFVDKLLRELKIGNVKQAILLTNNNTDTNFFQDAARQAAAVCFTKGRINFLKPDGSTSSPTNGQVFYYFGHRKKKFIEVFSKFGILMKAEQDAGDD
jgi:ParB family chromosome partitioning protein